MASGSSRRKMRCETGKCCCRGDHNRSCSPRATGKINTANEYNKELDDQFTMAEIGGTTGHRYLCRSLITYDADDCNCNGR